MTIAVVLLIAMCAVVGALALYRKLVSQDEDDFVHLADSSNEVITKQVKMASKLKLIDRIGFVFTAATVAYGVALLSTWLYMGIVRPPQ